MQLLLAIEDYPGGAVIYDADRRLQFINTRALQKTGFGVEQLLGRRDEELFPRQLTDQYVPYLRRAIETRATQTVEVIIPLPSRDVYLVATYVPLLDAEGRVQQVLGIGHDVTDQKLAAENVRRRERELRSLTDNVPDTMARVDRAGRFVFINRQAALRTGIAIKAFIGKTTRELGMPPDLVELWDQARQQVLDTAAPMEFEFAYPTPEGTYYFETRVIPELDAMGRVETIVGIARDVTYRRRAEGQLREGAEQLRRREQELRSVTDNVPDIISRFDRAGRHVYVNRQVESRTGIPADEFIGKTNRDLGMPEDLVQCWDVARQRAFDTAEPVEIEFSYPSPGGTRYFEARIIPERGADGAVDTVLGIARDVTDRKRAEMKVQESEERFRSAFEANPIGMILVAGDYSFIRANQAFCEMLGYTEQELRGLKFTDISHDKTAAGDVELAERVFRGEMQSYTYEKQCLTKDRRVIWARLTATVIRDEHGPPLYGLGMVENVTARRAAEEELARHREHLEELVRSRTRALEASQHSLRSAERLASVGTLAAGIAHEINNPVGAILLGTEMAMAAQASGDHAALTRCLEAIKGDAQRCGRIVRNVLNFARQEPSEKWLADFNEVVRQAVERAQPYAQKRGATVALRLDGDAPQALMNPTAFEQAVSNILRNAVDSRGEAAAIAVTTRIDGGHCSVIVEDNGTGMTPEIKMHIFDPFFTTRRTSGGIGLGLSLAHGTIADHQGTIEVESEPGKGTRCTIKLPRRTVSGPPSP